MQLAKLKLKIEDGFCSELSVNDIDLSMMASNVKINIGARDVPTATIDIYVSDAEIEIDGCKTELKQTVLIKQRDKGE